MEQSPTWETCICLYVEIKCQLDATDNFYCRSYCLFTMFRAPLCPSSGAWEYYKSGCCLSYLVLGFQVVGMVWSWGLCVWFAGCCNNWIGHILRRNCILKQVIEGKINGEMEVTRRGGRIRRKLLNYLKDKGGYSHLKEEALDRIMWRNRFGRGFGPVVRQNPNWMNEWLVLFMIKFG